MSFTASHSLSARVHQQIKEQVLNLRLRPGEVLIASRLAEEFGISRTPVREALVRLAQEELLLPIEGRKFRVTELTLTTILEIYEVRLALEGRAVTVAAERATPAQTGMLRAVHGRMATALDRREHEAFFAEDSHFHQAILDIGGNRTMKKILSDLATRVQRIRYLTLNIERRLERTIAEHQRILDGIAHRDAEGARAALEAHLTVVTDGIRELFDAGRPPVELGWLHRGAPPAARPT